MIATASFDASARVLFRVAAGARTGYGHLVRTRWLAEALGLDSWVSVRGGATARLVARRLGWHVAPSQPAAAATRRAAMVVIDDPNAVEAGRWCAVARRCGAPVVSLHDLGLAACDSDIAIDASLTKHDGIIGRRETLTGPRFAILSPDIRRRLRFPARCDRSRVLVALGGGRRATLAGRLARRIVGRRLDVRVAIAGGFEAGPASPRHPRIEWLRPSRGLVDELAASAVVIVGGGITTYEAVALGRPTVSVAVVAAQRPTVEAFAGAGAAIDGGRLAGSHVGAAQLDELVDRALALLDDERSRRSLGRTGRALIDGRGAERVARRLRRHLPVAFARRSEAA